MATHQDSSGSNPMSEAPKPETDFEKNLISVPKLLRTIAAGTHAIEMKHNIVLNAAADLITALSARLVEVERERDERTDCLAREIEALRGDVITAETALATAQGQLAEADAVIKYASGKIPFFGQLAEWCGLALDRDKARAAGKGTGK